MSRFGSPLAAVAAALLIFGCSSDDSDDDGAAGSGVGGSGVGGSGVGGSGVGVGGTGGGGQMMPAVTFTADVHPILLAKCGGGDCHDGDQAPFLPGHGAADVMDAYAATQEMSYTGDFVQERILARVTDEEAMMPPDFADPPCEGTIGTPGCITEAELALIEAWVEGGAPL